MTEYKEQNPTSYIYKTSLNTDINISCELGDKEESHHIANAYEKILCVLGNNLGKENVSTLVRYLRIDPFKIQQGNETTYFSITSDNKPKKVKYVQDLKSTTLLGVYFEQYGVMKIALRDTKETLQTICHEIGHGIWSMFEKDVIEYYHEEHSRLIQDKIIPEILKGRTPTSVCSQLLTRYAFLQSLTGVTSNNIGKDVVYKGSLEQIVEVFEEKPSGAVELKSIRGFAGPGEFFPELFASYMTNPKKVLRETPELFYSTQELLRTILGKTVNPLKEVA